MESIDRNVVFNKLLSLDSVLITYGIIYVNTNISKIDILSTIKENENFEDGDIFIKEITMANSVNEPDKIKKWLVDMLLKEEKIKLDAKIQEELKHANIFLDNMEKELEKQLQEKVGDIVGEEKEKGNCEG